MKVFFFSSRRRHTRSSTVSWARRCVRDSFQGRSAGPELDMGEIEYAFDSAARDRFSVALTREFQYKETNSHLRLQYSHDDTSEGKDDSIFIQFGFNFGQGEVR